MAGGAVDTHKTEGSFTFRVGGYQNRHLIILVVNT